MIPPGVTEVEVSLRKLRDYALNLDHEPGGNKARVLRAALGLTRTDAQFLRLQILQAANNPAMPIIKQERSEWGQRYAIDFPLTTPDGSATIRTGWIIDHGKTIFRLATCYVLR